MITADTITDEQILEATSTDGSIESLPDAGRFGSLPRLREIALRRVHDNDARRVYGEAGIRNTLKARARCAEILNARSKDQL